MFSKVLKKKDGMPRKISLVSLKSSVSSLTLSAISSISSASRSPSSSSSLTLNWEEEPLLLPTESGGVTCVYYPAKLSEELHDSRYRILRKLGWGNFSTVWLSRDTQRDAYVALKILTTKATECHAQKIIDEVSMLETITSADPSHPGFSHCVSLTDNFTHTSIFGDHICLAFGEVLGLSICDLRRGRRPCTVPLQAVKRIVKQVLLALEYLHDVCEIIHTDLKPDTILVCLPNNISLIERTLEDEPSQSYPQRDCAGDITSVVSQPLSTPPDVLDDPSLRIKVIDFGHAQRINDRLTDQIQSPSLRAPEVIMGYDWSTGVDIWSLGCIIFELLTGHWLFQPKKSHQWTTEEQHLQRMMEHTGQRFPIDMIESSSQGRSYFDDRGDLMRIRTLHSIPLESAVRHYKTVPEDDIASTGAFMRRCLTLDPRARPAARQLLSDDWFSTLSDK